MKRVLVMLPLLAVASASAQLRISEICPQPATTHPSTHEVIDQLDPNGKVSGWIELENISATESVDLANYQIVRTHRGKKIKDKPYSPANPKNDGPSMLPSRTVGPGERVLIYTSDEYDNDEEVDGLGLIVKEYNSIIVLPSKVNPKRFPMIQLYDYTSGSGVVVDRFIIPVDLPKGYAFVPGPDSAGRTNYVERIVVSTSNVLERTQSWTSAEALAWREPLANDESATSIPNGAYEIDETVAVLATATDSNNVARLDALDFSNADGVGDGNWLVAAYATNELASADAVTVSLWFFAPASAAPLAGGYVSLFDAQSANSAESGAVALWLDSDGALVAGRGGSAAKSAAGGLFDGAWHHVALVMGRNAGSRYAVFLDGAAVVDTADSNTGTETVAPTEASAVFAGVEVRPQVFARSLTATEVAQISAWTGPVAIAGSAEIELPAGTTNVNFGTTCSPTAATSVALMLDGTNVTAGTDIAVAASETPTAHTLEWVVQPTAEADGSCDIVATATVTGTVIDEIVIPPASATMRYIVETPTPLAANDVTGAIPYGPNAGPLYGVKHDLSDWGAFAQATNGQDYAVSLAVNPLSDLAGDAITSVRLIYRADFGTEVTNATPMALGAYDSKGAGQLYVDAIPSSALPAAGHLLRWAAVVEDAEGRVWRTPSFCDPDNAYQYYGTIVEPTAEQVSADLQTFHLFVDPVNHLSQMDVDADKQNRTLVPYGARTGIYDGQTGLYYDNVRIDLRGNTSASWNKKSHGLRFNKSQPLTCTDPFDGVEIETRKTSFIAEWPDPARIRQALSFKVLRMAGCPVPFDYPVRIQRNGEFYQMSFHSNRFTDELIEDWYGLDPKGYSYKNVGTFANKTYAGGIEKKTPEDGNEGDLTVLNQFCSYISGSQVTDADNSTGLDDATLTRKVVEKFDLPAWFNYLAVTKITTETDDVWANLSAYYDVNGTGTWMPLAYDLNDSWGQYYKDDLTGHPKLGTLADADWFKSHPFYGGNRVRAHKSDGGEVFGNDRNNRAFDVIWQNARFRRMYLRRLRTLMDEILKEPGTAKEDTPFWVWAQAVSAAENADYRLDVIKWNHGTGTPVWCWTENAFDWDKNGNAVSAKGMDDLWDNYIVPRRVHLFNTHSITNTSWEVGYATAKNAGIPEAQAPTANLAAGFSVVNVDAEGLFDTVAEAALVISNANNVAVDMSGWKLAGAVEYTFAPGTVIDAEGTLIVTTNRKAWVESKSQADLTALGAVMVVGNATFNPAVRALTLKDIENVEALSLAPPSNEATYLRVSEVMSVPPGSGDAGEYVVVTNMSDSVTLELAGISMAATKTGDANPKMSFTCETNSLPLAPGATYRFEQAMWWPSGKITNNKVDLVVRDAGGAVVQTLHFETSWDGFEATDGAGASLLALEFGDTVTGISQWKPSFTLPTNATASDAVSAAVDANPAVGWWLHDIAEQPEGAAAIAAFDGTAEDLASCYLVNIAPQADPNIDLKTLSISVAPDGTVTLTGDLDVNGHDYTGTLNGTIRMDLWRTLLEEPTETNLMIRSVSDPIEFPSGDWRFFRLKIK